MAVIWFDFSPTVCCPKAMSCSTAHALIMYKPSFPVGMSFAPRICLPSIATTSPDAAAPT